MATPEVVLGASVLALYLNLRLPLGFWTILIAHIMFTISFIVVAVKARLQGMDPRLEEAAQDLYASPWQTFRFVTFPLVLPGILGAALLGFALSFDDFIISNFASVLTNVRCAEAPNHVEPISIAFGRTESEGLPSGDDQYSADMNRVEPTMVSVSVRMVAKGRAVPAACAFNALSI